MSLEVFALWPGNALNLAPAYWLAQSLVALIQEHHDHALSLVHDARHHPSVGPVGVGWSLICR